MEKMKEEQIEQQLDAAMKDLNTQQVNERKPLPEIPEISGLSDKLMDAMVHAAEAQLTVAKSNLEQVRAAVDQIRHIVAKEVDRMTRMSDKLQKFGVQLCSAHEEFHKE